MSLVGIFRAKNGITALVDSKASIEYTEGHLEEYIGRNPEKLHPFPNGVAVVYGSLQVFTDHKGQIFSDAIHIETIIRSYIARHQTLDAGFFQELLMKMNTSPLNKDPVCFIIGRKIWTGKYQIEYHKVGYDYYAMKIGKETDLCFVGGSDVYVQDFRELEYRSKADSVEEMQRFTASKLQSMIEFYDEALPYNPVGGTVKSFIVR